jgi:uncharacterized protein with HEPN domain
MDNADFQKILLIKQYCEDIAKAISRFGNSYDTFENDIDYCNSVSMSILQIGELSIGLTDEFRESTSDQVPWELIRGMRNRFAHAYGTMDLNDIWETAIKDIPLLLLFCQQYT